ncbi:SOS response-associated peptidase family protein [Thalassotalea crassostreae]|uniref:SOS response-associated peptidase family protein n=1 Tax=Thalassotalea crassostreae TaxID=1763536 RepID=UPI000837ACEF|nr:SOS response-associated peptidase family protein [Thalassotalea crassostreae]
MCGRLNIIDDPFVRSLLIELGVESPLENVHWGRFKRATDTLSVVREFDGKRQLEQANWWLLQERTENGFKPSKYTSFNTRYDKLNTPRSAGYKAYRESRCVIPVKGFGETEFINKKPLHYYDFTTEDGQAMVLGGLVRQWFHPQTQQSISSCSVITLPPHEKLKHIHSKAMPLILPQHDNTIDMWLDSSLTNTQVFDDLLKPHLPQSLIATQIDKPSTYHAISQPIVINAD